MKPRRTSILALLLCALSADPSAHADLVTLDFEHAGNVVSNNSGAFQEAASLLVKFDPGSAFTRVTYLKFDLASLGPVVTDATLAFDSAGGGGGAVSNPNFVYDFDVYALNDGDLDEDWAPSISFQDGIGINTATHTPDPTRLTLVGSFQQTGSGVAGDPFALNTAALTSAIAADTDNQISFLIFRQQDDSNGNIIHAFVRSSFQLTVNSVPEPSSSVLAILFLSYSSIVHRKRREPLIKVPT